MATRQQAIGNRSKYSDQPKAEADRLSLIAYRLPSIYSALSSSH